MPLSLVEAEIVDPNHINIIFNQDVWCGADSPSNYTLFEGEDTSAVIPIAAAVLQEDDSTVSLTTGEAVDESIPYTLWADDICYAFYVGSHAEICFGNLPDLAVKDLQVDPFQSFEGCSSIEVSFNVSNTGKIPSGDFTISVWLVTDIEGEPDEIHMATFSYDSLNTGEDISEAFTYTLAPHTGGYNRVKLIIDDSGLVTEIREDNNKKEKDIWSPELHIISITDRENDYGGMVRIVFNKSYRDRLCDFMHDLQNYRIFRRIDQALPPGTSHSGKYGDEPDHGGSVQRLNEAGGTSLNFEETPEWELVGEIPASGQQEYTAYAPTLADSTAENGIYWSVYKIEYSNLSSCPDSGYSTVNIQTATVLQGYSASYMERCIKISWSLSRMDEGVEFNILRAEDGGGFHPVHEPDIECRLLDFTFKDRDITCGKSYRYRVDYSKGGINHILFETEPVRTPVLPLTLYQNYPNPFNPATNISYYLPEAARVVLEIYDVSGRKVTCLVDEYKERGDHTANWSGRDELGIPVSSGIYFYKLHAGKKAVSKKMVLLQ